MKNKRLGDYIGLGEGEGLKPGVLKHVTSRTGEGKSLLIPDYSQLEIKVLADLTKEDKLNRSKKQKQSFTNMYGGKTNG